MTHRVNVACTRADGTAVRIHPHNGKQLKGEASGREEGGPSASWLAAASELASDAACELASAHKLRSACRLRDLLRHGGSQQRTRAVALVLCYGLSPRTEQLQSVIVTQKPGRACAAEEPSEEVMQQDSACLPRAPREPPRIHL